MRRLQRRDLQLPRAARRACARAGTASRRERHRGDRAPLRGARRRLRAPAARDVRVRDLGRPPRRAPARARPGRQEAALLRRCAAASCASPPSRARSCSDPAVPRDVDLARDRRLPRQPVRAARPVRVRGAAQAAAGEHGCAGAPAASRAIERYWRLEYAPEAPRSGSSEARRAAARGDPRGDARCACAATCRSARSCPAASTRASWWPRWRRQSAEPVRTFSIGFPDTPLRRDRPRARGRRALRHRPRGAAASSPTHCGDAPADRLALRRAVRRPCRDCRPSSSRS